MRSQIAAGSENQGKAIANDLREPSYGKDEHLQFEHPRRTEIQIQALQLMADSSQQSIQAAKLQQMANGQSSLGQARYLPAVSPVNLTSSPAIQMMRANNGPDKEPGTGTGSVNMPTAASSRSFFVNLTANNSGGMPSNSATTSAAASGSKVEKEREEKDWGLKDDEERRELLAEHMNSDASLSRLFDRLEALDLPEDEYQALIDDAVSKAADLEDAVGNFIGNLGNAEWGSTEVRIARVRKHILKDEQLKSLLESSEQPLNHDFLEFLTEDVNSIEEAISLCRRVLNNNIDTENPGDDVNDDDESTDDQVDEIQGSQRVRLQREKLAGNGNTNPNSEEAYAELVQTSEAEGRKRKDFAQKVEHLCPGCRANLPWATKAVKGLNDAAMICQVPTDNDLINEVYSSEIGEFRAKLARQHSDDRDFENLIIGAVRKFISDLKERNPVVDGSHAMNAAQTRGWKRSSYTSTDWVETTPGAVSKK
ncbi:MAG: hypothetical protein V4721_02485 [Bacteroidota bacterium]